VFVELHQIVELIEVTESEDDVSEPLGVMERKELSIDGRENVGGGKFTEDVS